MMNLPYDECVASSRQITTTTSTSTTAVVDTIVNAASICNSLVTEYCGLCTFYIDKQVQYELIAGSNASHAGFITDSYLPSSTFQLQHHEEYFGTMDGRQRAVRDVNQAASMLFDEDSVVESISSR
jgi:hypothetical protein